ncbi:hypothetical protein JKG47_18045, partial [Acidithiobacillus sp. MC6.1]|nr:hypothetical protein [Acidithiobacillus sp. MC6.1]
GRLSRQEQVRFPAVILGRLSAHRGLGRIQGGWAALGRGAGMSGVLTQRPARAVERHGKEGQACQRCEYSEEGEREARGHVPPPQRGSYRALDALGLRRGMGVLQSQPCRRILLAGKKSLQCACRLPVDGVKGPRQQPGKACCHGVWGYPSAICKKFLPARRRQDARGLDSNVGAFVRLEPSHSRPAGGNAR